MNTDNPFQPGTGQTPPRLAGREAEQAEYRKFLSRLRNKKRGNMAVMYGPRGVGKTALLAWLKRACEKEGMTAVRAVPDDAGELSAARIE